VCTSRVNATPQPATPTTRETEPRANHGANEAKPVAANVGTIDRSNSKERSEEAGKDTERDVTYVSPVATRVWTVVPYGAAVLALRAVLSSTADTDTRQTHTVQPWHGAWHGYSSPVHPIGYLLLARSSAPEKMLLSRRVVAAAGCKRVHLQILFPAPVLHVQVREVRAERVANAWKLQLVELCQLQLLEAKVEYAEVLSRVTLAETIHSKWEAVVDEIAKVDLRDTLAVLGGDASDALVACERVNVGMRDAVEKRRHRLDGYALGRSEAQKHVIVRPNRELNLIDRRRRPPERKKSTEVLDSEVAHADLAHEALVESQLQTTPRSCSGVVGLTREMQHHEIEIRRVQFVQ
jgi:hypothetical protein